MGRWVHIYNPRAQKTKAGLLQVHVQLYLLRVPERRDIEMEVGKKREGWRRETGKEGRGGEGKESQERGIICRTNF